MVCQVDRGAPFAATDRSYMPTGDMRGVHVGAVCGREKDGAVYQAEGANGGEDDVVKVIDHLGPLAFTVPALSNRARQQLQSRS